MLEYLLEYKTLLQVAVTERRLMSVLEKIIQAERDASALLLQTHEESTTLIASAHDELVSLKTKNAQEVAKEINALTKNANEEIATLSAKTSAKHEQIAAAIDQSAASKKAKVIDQIFKDITVL